MSKQETKADIAKRICEHIEMMLKIIVELNDRVAALEKWQKDEYSNKSVSLRSERSERR